MVNSAFIIDYSGGTVGESHPVPFFQIQHPHANASSLLGQQTGNGYLADGSRLKNLIVNMFSLGSCVVEVDSSRIGILKCCFIGNII